MSVHASCPLDMLLISYASVYMNVYACMHAHTFMYTPQTLMPAPYQNSCFQVIIHFNGGPFLCQTLGLNGSDLLN